MKNHKKRNIIGFVLVLAVIAACAFVALVGVGDKHQGSAKNIKLGLDLAGGVSITYEVNEDNPSAEDMNDTVYKLQQRVSVYSTEAEVYQQGADRIVVEIPGVYNAEEMLATLGNPGTIEFYEQGSTDSSDEDETEESEETQSSSGFDASLYGWDLVLDGNDVVDAQVTTQQNEYGNSEYVVRVTFSSEGGKKV